MNFYTPQPMPQMHNTNNAFQTPQYSPPSPQPIFPQPSGNVYSINNTLEVANVPTGVGMSVALCFPENLMYIKTMQNGSPLFYAYRITPYSQEEKQAPNEEPSITIEGIQAEINDINSTISKLKKDLGVE